MNNLTPLIPLIRLPQNRKSWEPLARLINAVRQKLGGLSFIKPSEIFAEGLN
jgi:hypothetical protein